MAESRKTILGIDPGTNLLGFGVITVTGGRPSYTDMGVLDLRKEQDSYVKLGKIYEKVSSLIDTYHPDTLACESPFYGKNAQVILKLGRAQGAAITAAAHRGVPVAEYAPREAKMAIAGNGAASKQQVNIMVQKTLGVCFDPKFLDATDALAIALCHHYQSSSPLAGASGCASSSSKSASASWARFIDEHPDRIR